MLVGGDENVTDETLLLVSEAATVTEFSGRDADGLNMSLVAVVVILNPYCLSSRLHELVGLLHGQDSDTGGVRCDR